MRLTQDQIDRYDEQGFLVFPGLLDATEVGVIDGAIPDLLARTGADVIREENDPATVRMVFGAHFHHDVFARLARHPRLVTPSEQLVRDRVHVYQSRLNAKSSFHGSGWAWHQDFNQWHRQDGMLRPQTVVIGIYLDEVNACNGPLLIIRGSHRHGHFHNPTGMEIDDGIVSRLAAEGGIEPIMGPPGTVVCFDALAVHGSAPNISPWPRRIFYLNYNAVSNDQIQPLRASFHCSVDMTPVSALGDDCLRRRNGNGTHADTDTRIRTQPFAPPLSIAGREEELLTKVLRSGCWSGFRAGAGGDPRKFLAMSSADALQLAPSELRFLGGPMVRQLEAMFAARCDTKYAVAVTSATSGLIASFGALSLEPGDEVLVPCMSFHATATAVLAFDAVPVFVDVDPETLCLDVADAEAKISDRTRAIAAVHLGGNVADLDALHDLARRHNLRIVEDCAQAPGARWRGREVGGFGDAGVFSLTETKTITCGEGGVVVTSDPNVAAKLRLIRNHGEGIAGEDWSDAELANVIGHNLRLTEFQAAVAIAQLEQLDARNAARRANTEHLRERLRGMLVPQRIDSHVEEAPYAATFRYLRRDGMPSRDDVVAQLQKEGIPAVAGYPRLLHEHPLFTSRIAYGTAGHPFSLRPGVTYGTGTLPRSEAVNRELIWFTCINSPNTTADMDDIVRGFERVLSP